MRRVMVMMLAVFVVVGLIAPVVCSAQGKIGYVDLRRAFYEYKKTKVLEDELTGLTEESQETRNEKVAAITKMRESAELLSDDAKAEKQIQSSQGHNQPDQPPAIEGIIIRVSFSARLVSAPSR